MADSTQPSIRLDSSEEYTVAWIAALSHERAAAEALLDERHEKPAGFERKQGDSNAYTWGKSGMHNIVITALPAGVYGTTITATLVTSLRLSLPHIRTGLLVGIGAGVPQPDQEDIRLGDIVVSQPYNTSGGVVQYDLMKAKQGHHSLTGHLARPPDALLTALGQLKSHHMQQPSKVPAILRDMHRRNPQMARSTRKLPGFIYQGVGEDRLFADTSKHVGGPDCDGCGEAVERETRETTDPEIHYGIIASGNTLVKTAEERHEILQRLPESEREKCFCIEMEAAGLMNEFPCLVIRGVCDYGDAHKNDRWQNYAAATAACFAKEFLGFLDAEDVKKLPNLHEVLQNMQNDVAVIRKTGADTQSMVERFESSDDQKKIKGWLDPPNSSSNHIKALDQSCEGTGEWFTCGKPYSDFKSGAVPFLWLHGMTGCGKTILSSSIIKDLEQDTSLTVLSFYFDFSDTRKQSLDSALRSLLWQLANCSGGPQQPFQELQRLYDLCGGGTKDPPTKEMISCFDTMLRNYDGVKLVLDALDECKVRTNLLSWLAQLNRSGSCPIHILATSRPERDIETAFEDWLPSENVLPIKQADVNSDIRSYIKTTIRTDSLLKIWRDNHEIKARIEEKLMEKAAGMFLWARFQMDSIVHCHSLQELDATLSSLPKDLDQTYDRILKRIEKLPHASQCNAVKILQVLTWCDEPLLVKEAADFLAVDIDGTPGYSAEYEHQTTNPKEILRLCPSLVSIVRERNGTGRVRERLQLAHLSMQEYLRSDRVIIEYKTRLTEAAASLCIAKVCLVYMLHTADSRRQHYEPNNFYYNAWLQSARLAEPQDKTVQDMVMQFLTDSPRMTLWVRTYDIQTRYSPVELPRARRRAWAFSEEFVRAPPPLYYASLGGLEHTVLKLIKDGADVNQYCGPNAAYGKALQAASLAGHEKVVKILIKEGANVNDHGWGVYGNALQAACIGPNERVVQMLLNHDVYINAKGGLYGYALQAACAKGSTRVAQTLIGNGADIDAQGGAYGTALLAACRYGFAVIANMLLEKGVDRACPKGFGALDCFEIALENGHASVLDVFFQHGEDPNRLISNGRTILIEAASTGANSVIRVLLKRGADVNFQDFKGRTALHMAASQGMRDTVAILLDNRADATIHDAYGATALRTAIYDQRVGVVELLLSRNEGSTSVQLTSEPLLLHWAAVVGNQALIRTLLEYGAPVDIIDSVRGQTALHRATEHGHEWVVSLLLQERADVNIRDNSGKSALDYAVDRARVPVIRLLLAGRAYSVAQVQSSRLTLHWAAERGCEAIIALLLDIGYPINNVDRFKRTALHIATEHAYEAVMTLLLSRKVDVNAQDIYGKTALHRAAERANETQKSLLLRWSQMAAEREAAAQREASWAVREQEAGQRAVRQRTAAQEAACQKAAERWTAERKQMAAEQKRKAAEQEAAEKLAVEQANAAQISLLLHGSANPNLTNSGSETVLHVISDHGQTSLARLLLSFGADPDLVDKSGRTTLHRAVRGGHASLVQLLIEQGADASVEDSCGNTALHNAFDMDNREIQDMFQ